MAGPSPVESSGSQRPNEVLKIVEHVSVVSGKADDCVLAWCVCLVEQC